MRKGLVVVVAIVVALGVWITMAYNRLVTLDEQVAAAWSEVENNYQRRMDLVPNLVETVKGVAGFEKETYVAVAEARAQAGKIQLSPELLRDPQAFAAFEQAQGKLSTALSRLLVTIEKYPDLKANQSFQDLMTQLEGTENRIAVARKRFNEAVRAFNTRVRRFPGNIVAGMLGFDAKPYFKAQAGAAEAPKVKF